MFARGPNGGDLAAGNRPLKCMLFRRRHHPGAGRLHIPIGVADALAAAGMSIDDVPIAETCATPEEERAFGSGAALLLDRAPDATAVIAFKDSIALSVIGEARKRGLDVPRDLSVVGFDDIPEAALSEPPLTTIHVSAAENGRAAARLLLQGGPPQQVVTPVTLVVRRSTAPPRKGKQRKSAIPR